MKINNNSSFSEITPPPNDSFMSKIYESFKKIVNIYNNILHIIASILLFLLMILTIADVVGRSILNKPITGTYEITGLLLAIIVFFSLGKTQLSKGHIEIDIITDKLSKKTQNILESIVSLMLFLLTLLITWQLYEYGLRTFQGNETTGDLGLPLWIFIGFTLFGALAYSLSYLLNSIQLMLRVVKRNES